MMNEDKNATKAPITRLSYIVCGSGPGLLLAHGCGMTVQSNFSALIGPLSERFTVVGPDYPGSGTTPRATEPLLLDMLADQMVATAVQAGVERFAVLGYSMGCAIALRTATRHPDRVTALILTAGFAQLDTTPRIKTPMMYGQAEGENHNAWARSQISLSISRRYINSMSEEDLEGLVELIASRAASGAAEHADLAARIDVRSDLPKVSVPTLVINMKEDQLVSPQISRALADGILGAQVAELDCGHLPIDRYPEWQRLVLDFLSTLPAVTKGSK